MKKLSSWILVVVMLLTMVFSACAETKTVRIGELTWLNNTEADRTAYMDHLVNYVSGEKTPDDDVDIQYETVTFDNLNSMLMGLTSGQIDQMMIYFIVGAYLTTQNEGIALELTAPSYGPTASPALVYALTDVYKGTDFSFMMLDTNTELCEAFNEAIRAMKEDGTLYAIESSQITSAISGEEIQPVILEKIDGADTIRVAVTGDLPPLDYIAPDGMPAGFNTAVLAEISRRIGKNIELVSIDAGGRATALASGAVDVVFWARVNTPSETVSGMLTEEELSMIESLKTEFDAFRSADEDLPAGVICTDPYYHDVFVNVVKE